MLKIGILVISDKCVRGEREDKCIPTLLDILKEVEGEVIAKDILPDEKEIIVSKLKEYVDDLGCDLVLTAGGTGIGKRDVTPEATGEVIEKELPGLAEIQRIQSYKITPHAIISRAKAGIRKNSLIVNLPGRPKAIKENLALILPVIPHICEILSGKEEHDG